MNKVFVLLLTSYCLVIAKEKTISLSDSVAISLSEKKININNHFGRSLKESNVSGIYFINDQPVYGTDFETPNSKLDYAFLSYNGKKISLDTSFMYNPCLNLRDINSFKIRVKNKVLVISALFSDGAGTYIVQWFAVNDHSERILISNDEYIISRFYLE